MDLAISVISAQWHGHLLLSFFLPTLTGEGDLTNFQWSESIQIWYAASLRNSLGLFLDLVENIEFFSTFDIFEN